MVTTGAIVQLNDEMLGDLFLVISCHDDECEVEVLDVEVVRVKEKDFQMRLDVDLIRTGNITKKSASSLQVVTVFGTDRSEKIPEYKTKN